MKPFTLTLDLKYSVDWTLYLHLDKYFTQAQMIRL